MASSWSLTSVTGTLGFWALTGAIGCSLLLLLLLLDNFAAASASTRKPPPGPRGLPVLGNALQLPTSLAEKMFHEWGKIFGTHRKPLELERVMLTYCGICRGRRVLQDISHPSHRTELLRGRPGPPGQTQCHILRPTATSSADGNVRSSSAIARSSFAKAH